MKGGFEISAPPIVNDFGLPAIIPFLLAAATAYLFWNSVVPRQLRGLQVAFQTGEKRYEVHNVTISVKMRGITNQRHEIWRDILPICANRCIDFSI